MFSILLIVPLVNAFPTQKQNSDINITQGCSTCTFVNITHIQLGDGSDLKVNEAMTKDGTFYNYTLNSSYTSSLGEYCVFGYGDDGADGIWHFCFNVTPTGEESTTSDTIFYGILLLILFIVDIFSFYMVFGLTLDNPRNEEGEVLGISLQKYGKIVVIGLLYGLILLTLNLMNAVSQSLFSIPQFSGIIGGLFLVMLSLAWYWTILIIMWLIYTAYKDSTLYKDLMKAYGEAGG